MSQLNIDTIQNRSGGPVTLTMQSAAKAWAGIVSSTGVGMDNSLNVSSQTDEGTGDFDYNLTNSASAQMDEYCFSGMPGGGARVIRVGSNDTTTSVFDAKTHNISGTLLDCSHSWSWIGDLA